MICNDVVRSRYLVVTFLQIYHRHQPMSSLLGRYGCLLWHNSLSKILDFLLRDCFNISFGRDLSNVCIIINEPAICRRVWSILGPLGVQVTELLLAINMRVCQYYLWRFTPKAYAVTTSTQSSGAKWILGSNQNGITWFYLSLHYLISHSNHHRDLHSRSWRRRVTW